MQKLCLSHFALLLFTATTFSQNNNRLLDQTMKLRNVSIKINADAFTATTLVEIEFYNPNEKEIEGLFRFGLDSGQVITGFQLDMNGKYRDGSIEERWKARATYNTIVGKKVDPALLQMEWRNNYRLNVYPVPAKGSRKVIIAIQQIMAIKEKFPEYRLPAFLKYSINHLNVDINVQHILHEPIVNTGLLEGNYFSQINNAYHLTWLANDIVFNVPIVFALPFYKGETLTCNKQLNGKNYFAICLKPALPKTSEISAKKITVFWDVSGSASNRDIKKEINFLQQFIQSYKIQQVDFICFNDVLQDSVTWYAENKRGINWQNYLRSFDYNGATRLGCMDFSTVHSRIIFLFSDGINTYKNDVPKRGTAPVYCIRSSYLANFNRLEIIAGSSGGTYIDLLQTSIADAITTAGKSVNWLMQIHSSTGKILCDQYFPTKWSEAILISGALSSLPDTLSFYFGNEGGISTIKKVFIAGQHNCNETCLDRMSMLMRFKNMQSNYNWEQMLDFGLSEQIVTANTSFIVLEKAEDYIKYNIAPPKDLEEECNRMQYAKIDSRFLRQRMKLMDDYEMMTNVVNEYNKRIKLWDISEAPIRLLKADFEKLPYNNINATPTASSSLSGTANGIFIGGSSALSEVVVTGYGVALKRNITGSVAYVRRNELAGSLTVEQALQGRVAGLSVSNAYGTPGSQASITIRGNGSLSGTPPLMVLDGMPVAGNINDLINVTNIENITVLKDASATAIYGSRAANGVIIINSKKPGYYNYYYNNNSKYRLDEMDDVEYMEEIKSASANEKLAKYEELKINYGRNTSFYFDMAKYLFEVGFGDKAKRILLNALEIAGGNAEVCIAAGYVFESWKNFDEAIQMYQQALYLQPNNIQCFRNLAWAYYQHGNYQNAVDILYDALQLNMEYEEYYAGPAKSILLNELNAMNAMHKSEINISKIPPQLIRPLPADLRIVIECNNNNLYNVSVTEPGKAVCSKDYQGKNCAGYVNAGIRMEEYQIKEAKAGRYKIAVNFYSGYSQSPSVLRITTYRNFGKKEQSMKTEILMMDNQYGEIEIGEATW